MSKQTEREPLCLKWPFALSPQSLSILSSNSERTSAIISILQQALETGVINYSSPKGLAVYSLAYADEAIKDMHEAKWLHQSRQPYSALAVEARKGSAMTSPTEREVLEALPGGAPRPVRSDYPNRAEFRRACAEWRRNRQPYSALAVEARKGSAMTSPTEREVLEALPGGAPDLETQELMTRLSDLQSWCALMMRKDSGGVAAAQLVQDTRAFIVERLYPRAQAAALAREGE